MTLLIKNGQIIDGLGRPASKNDVLVKNEKIAAIGNFPRYKADETIDASGSYIFPGFIDINTDSDHYLTLFSHPQQEDFLIQGVTTIVGGQCGASLAPLIYGSLDSFKQWTDVAKRNVNWATFDEFYAVLKQKKFGVNFATLVGHTTIRQDIAGETFRNIDLPELKILKSVLARSLKEGAFGFSTGLGYNYAHQTNYLELVELAKITADNGALYATHLRNEKEGILFSVNETVNLAKKTGVKTLISHFRPLKGFEKDYEECLELINKNATEADIHFDISPTDVSIVAVCAFLPSWLKVKANDEKTMLLNLKNREIREKVLKELPKIKSEETFIVSAPRHEYLAGKTLKSFNQNRRLTSGEGLLKLIEITEGRAVLFCKNINIKNVIKALSHEKAIIASNNSSPSKSLIPDDYPFLKFLKLTEEKKIMTIEKAVHKITGLPAVKLGLKDRGFVKEGNFADLVVFKSGEIRDVILNGKIGVKDGHFQNVLSGKILKR